MTLTQLNLGAVKMKSPLNVLAEGGGRGRGEAQAQG